MLLSAAAAISLSLCFNQDFAQTRHEGEPPVGLVECISSLIVILIIVLVGFLNDQQKEEQLRALDEKRDRAVKVIVRCDGSDTTAESGAIKKLSPDGVQLLDSEGVA